MVELKLTDGKSPMLFTSPDYELVVMPMLTSESQKPEGKVEATKPEADAAVEANGVFIQGTLTDVTGYMPCSTVRQLAALSQ
jgi:hypothetical protein